MSKRLNLSFLFGLILTISIGIGFAMLFFYHQSKETLNTFSKDLAFHLESETEIYPPLLNSINQLYLNSENKMLFSYQLERLFVTENRNFDLIGIAPLMNETELNRFLTDIRKQGFENFQLKKFQSSFQHGEHYAIIQHLAPFTPQNTQYLGKDFLSIPSVKDAFSRGAQMHTNAFYDPQSKSIFIFKPLKPSSASEVNFGFVMVQASLEKLIAHLRVPENTHLSMSFRGHATEHLTASNQNGWLTLQENFSLNLQGLETAIEVTQSLKLSQNQTLSLIIVSILLGIVYLLVFVFYKDSKLKNHYLGQNQKRYKQLLENTYDGIIATDSNNLIQLVNPVAENLLGYSQSELINKPIGIILNVQPDVEALKGLKASEQAKNNFQTNIFTKDIQSITCRINVSDIDIEGFKESIYFIEDITKQQENETRIKRMAYYDALTQLESREYFQENLMQIFSQPFTTSVFIFFIDLDGFKKVNDSLGHNTGDNLLKIISQRIQTALQDQENIHICRFGGDEFIISIETDQQTYVHKIADHLLKAFSRRTSLEQHEIQISASIGISNYPRDGHDPDTLLRRADAAMYLAKENGKNTYAFYNEALEEQLSNNLTIENRLRNAIDQGNFQLHYQPQTDLKTGQVNSVEALIRWIDDELGFVPPDEFISVAEDTGQILQIGDWVIAEAIHQLSIWQKHRDLKHIKIAINVSSQQLKVDTFRKDLIEKLNNANLPQDLLEIELTERSVMTNAKENIHLFAGFRDSGFSLSVDDFGTGYSSLSYLKRFPLNILKVDKSFVDGIPDDEDDLTLTRTIINLAHSLNMKVVAEGVETEAQLNELKRLDCDIVQGYYYAKPLPAEKFEDWYREYCLTLEKSNGSH